LPESLLSAATFGRDDLSTAPFELAHRSSSRRIASTSSVDTARVPIASPIASSVTSRLSLLSSSRACTTSSSSGRTTFTRSPRSERAPARASGIRPR
jgi:hypothetical protein